MAGFGSARLGRAWQGKARRGAARQGKDRGELMITVIDEEDEKRGWKLISATTARVLWARRDEDWINFLIMTGGTSGEAKTKQFGVRVKELEEVRALLLTDQQQ
jgi:hypothetical protein